VLRAVRRSSSRSASLSGRTRGPTGTLSQYATIGAATHSSRNGAAGSSAGRLAAAITTATPAPMIGLDLISETNRCSAFGPLSPAAVAAAVAAVSHSSSRRRVTRRTTVSPIACAVSNA
jgi:hypothetical protein